MSWRALHADLIRSSNRLSFQRQFEKLQACEALLAESTDPAVLLGRQHGPGDPDAKNAVLAALVRSAQSNDTLAGAAITLLLLALWPGMDAIRHRLQRHFRGDPDVLAAEISGRIAMGIRELDLRRVNRIAATLLRNAERDIRRSLHARWAEDLRLDPLDEEEARIDPLSVPGREASDPGLSLDALTDLLGEDAALVFAVVVLGERQQEASARLGLGYVAARKRYQRAITRLKKLWPRN